MASLMDPSSYPVGPPCTYRASGFPDTRYIHTSSTMACGAGGWQGRTSAPGRRSLGCTAPAEGGRSKLELELELELEHNATVHRRIGWVRSLQLRNSRSALTFNAQRSELSHNAQSWCVWVVAELGDSLAEKWYPSRLRGLVPRAPVVPHIRSGELLQMLSATEAWAPRSSRTTTCVGAGNATSRRLAQCPVSCVLCPGTFAPALLGSWREAAMVPSDRARRTYSTLHAIHNSREFRGSRACTGGMACAFRLPARRPHPAELWRVHNSRLGARGGLRLARCCACGLVGHRLRLHRRVSGPGVSAHVRVHWYARVCMYARSYRYDREPGRSPVCAARVILASKRRRFPSSWACFPIAISRWLPTAVRVCARDHG